MAVAEDGLAGLRETLSVKAQKNWPMMLTMVREYAGVFISAGQLSNPHKRNKMLQRC